MSQKVLDYALGYEYNMDMTVFYLCFATTVFIKSYTLNHFLLLLT